MKSRKSRIILVLLLAGLVYAVWRNLRVTRAAAQANEIRWLLYLGPPSRCAAAVLRYATDGYWLEGGKPYPFYRRTAIFFKWKLGPWLFWLRTQLLPAHDAAPFYLR